MRKFMEIAGVIMFVLGLCAGDSENLLIPLAMLAAGSCLYNLGVR